MLSTIQDEGVYKTIDLTIAPEKKLSIKDVQKAANDYGLFAHTTRWDDAPAIAEDKEDESFLERHQLNSLNLTNRIDINIGEVKKHTVEL